MSVGALRLQSKRARARFSRSFLSALRIGRSGSLLPSEGGMLRNSAKDRRVATRKEEYSVGKGSAPRRESGFNLSGRPLQVQIIFAKPLCESSVPKEYSNPFGSEGAYADSLRRREEGNLSQFPKGKRDPLRDPKESNSLAERPATREKEQNQKYIYYFNNYY